MPTASSTTVQSVATNVGSPSTRRRYSRGNQPTDFPTMSHRLAMVAFTRIDAGCCHRRCARRRCRRIADSTRLARGTDDASGRYPRHVDNACVDGGRPRDKRLDHVAFTTCRSPGGTPGARCGSTSTATTRKEMARGERRGHASDGRRAVCFFAAASCTRSPPAVSVTIAAGPSVPREPQLRNATPRRSTGAADRAARAGRAASSGGCSRFCN